MFTERPNVIDVKLLHPENAELPIEVTFSGIAIDAKLAQSINVPTSIEVTDSGIVIDVKLLHLEKA